MSNNAVTTKTTIPAPAPTPRPSVSLADSKASVALLGVLSEHLADVPMVHIEVRREMSRAMKRDLLIKLQEKARKGNLPVPLELPAWVKTTMSDHSWHIRSTNEVGVDNDETFSAADIPAEWRDILGEPGGVTNLSDEHRGVSIKLKKVPAGVRFTCNATDWAGEDEDVFTENLALNVVEWAPVPKKTNAQGTPQKVAKILEGSKILTTASGKSYTLTIRARNEGKTSWRITGKVTRPAPTY